MASPNPEDELPSAGLTYALGVVVTLVLIAIAAVAYVVMQPGEPPARPEAPPPPTASTPQPPPPEALAPSLMTLTSTPPGASVFAGPLELGKTPVSLDMLQPGKKYELRLEMDGYQPKAITLSVDPTSGETERNVVLEEE
jgi:serine/threonine-protein kinase